MTVMTSFKTCDITITTVKGIDYSFIIYDISKYDPNNLLENLVLDDCGYT